MYKNKRCQVLHFVLLLLSVAAFSCGGSGSGKGISIDTGPFIRQANNAECSEIRNNLFVIDDKLVLWDRAGNCPDNSYSRTLYGQNIDQVLCQNFDSIAGPVKACDNQQYEGLFDTMLANLDKPDLGLGSEHKVASVSIESACNTNADCLSSQYCAKAVGDCGGRGECAVRPDVCPLAPVAIGDLVCGCDGKTYGYYINACDAAMAGMNIAHEGACK